MPGYKEKTKKYLVEIEVDIESLREVRKDLDDDFEIQEAVEQEFGWLHQSGIYLGKIKSVKKKTSEKQIA